MQLPFILSFKRHENKNSEHNKREVLAHIPTRALAEVLIGVLAKAGLARVLTLVLARVLA